jgi:hypothetical protein
MGYKKRPFSAYIALFQITTLNHNTFVQMRLQNPEIRLILGIRKGGLNPAFIAENAKIP